ncbi:MAG: universal stress protein [Desulfobacteraceae bacterium]
MADVQKILFPMELVALSEEIAPWVELMARKFEAEIHVLHVIPDPGYWGVPYGMDPVHLDDQSSLIHKAEVKVKSFCKEHLGEGVRLGPVKVVVGDPAGEILRHIKDEGVSMVIMGTHGRRGLEKVVFGSVVDRVVKSSPVPVLSVNPHAKNL